MTKLHMHQRICISCSKRVSKCVRWCSQHPSNAHTCAWCSQYLLKWLHTLRKKCICARACAHTQQCRSFFTIKLLRTYLEYWASIVQAVVCRPPNWCLDQTHDPTLFAQEIHPNPRKLMAQSQLQCYTSIIWSSALVQASSSLSVGRTCA